MRILFVLLVFIFCRIDNAMRSQTRRELKKSRYQNIDHPQVLPGSQVQHRRIQHTRRDRRDPGIKPGSRMAQAS